MMVKLYHFTTYDGLRDIKREKVIRVSRGGSSSSSRDMMHGAGVYLTALDPERHSKEEIAANNWAKGGEKRLREGNTDYYVEVDIPASDQWLERCRDKNDKWVFRRDLQLEEYQWRSGKNTDWKDDLLAGAGILGGIGLLAGLVFGGTALYNQHCKEKEEEEKRKH